MIQRSLTALALLLPAATAAADQVVLQPSKDNTLFEDASGMTANGSGQHFFAGKTASGSIRRGLVAFDVAGNVPAGSTINSVSLQLHMSQTIAPPQTVTLHRVLEDWAEGPTDADLNEGGGAAVMGNDATWIHTSFPASFWSTPGGSFVGTVSGSSVVDFIGFYTWNSTAQMVSDVQGWLDSPAANFGWLVRGNEGANVTAKRFDSVQNNTDFRRPMLTIDFTPPTSNGPGTASCFGVGCPCGNDDATAGCANSTGSGGLLGGTGTTSASADDLVLDVTGLPPNNNGLFYMGDSVVSNSFFDGFQCALGTTFRFLGSIQSSGAGGTMSYTGVVADSGALITAGSTWHFHCWHRDVPGTPCGTGANLTNLYSVTFTP